MAETLFQNLNLKEGTRQKIQNDAMWFEEKNPLDETLLREIEQQISDLTACGEREKVKITVLGLDDFQRAVKSIVPRRLLDRGLANHIRVLHDPRNPHHVMIGPSALAGLNEGHMNVVTDLVYHLLSATGYSINEAFDRGVSDILAGEIAKKLGLEVFSNHYPQERAFVQSIVEAVKGLDQSVVEVVGIIKSDPKSFYTMVKNSSFYRWWTEQVQAADSRSIYVNLIQSMMSPNAQLEGSFMNWAGQCAKVYRDYRLEQQRRGRMAAKKRRLQEEEKQS